MKKLVSLSTSYLRVYEDDPKDPNNIDVPKVLEPTTKILHEIRLKCFGCGSNPCDYGFQIQTERHPKISTLNCTSYNKTGGSGLDLLFDSTIVQTEFLGWNEAIQIAEDLSTKGLTLLDELKIENSPEKCTTELDREVLHLL